MLDAWTEQGYSCLFISVGWPFYKILDIQKELCFHLLLPTLFVFRKPFPKGSWERKVKAYGFDDGYLSLLSLHRYFMDVIQEWLFFVLQSCPFASRGVKLECRLWWGRLSLSLHWKIDWKFYHTNLEQQILYLCSELLFQCPVPQLLPLEWTTPRSSLSSGFSTGSQVSLACGAEEICPNCS